MEQNSMDLTDQLRRIRILMDQGFYDEATVSMRRICEHMALWLVYDAGLYGEASSDQYGKPQGKPGDFNSFLFELRSHRLIADDLWLMMNRIRIHGNRGAHPNEKGGVDPEQSREDLRRLQAYLPKFLEKFPQASILGTKPDGKIAAVHKNVLGCDIGNSFAFVSCLQNARFDPVPLFPAKYAAQYQMDRIGMPATAYVGEDGTIEVFSERPASQRHHRTPERFVHAVKNRFQESDLGIPGVSVSPDAVYGAIARDLVQLAHAEQKNRGDAPSYEIVYAFPAMYSRDLPTLNRMKNSLEQVTVQGKHLHVLGRLPEPAAAAIDYLYFMQYLEREDSILRDGSYTALVYDLGHGTFDGAVVTASAHGRPYQLHLFDGEAVGGKDFDVVIFREFLNILRTQYQYVPTTPVARSNILSCAIHAKLSLSSAEDALENVELPSGDYAELSITRKHFEALSASILGKTIDCTQRLARQAKEQGLKIDALILSGGASQMPMVSRRLREVFDPLPVKMHRPGYAVSFGTARFAHEIDRISQKPNRILKQTAHHPAGILISSDVQEGTVRYLIQPGQPLPAQSEPLSFYNPSGRAVIRLYRAFGTESQETGPADQSFEVARIPFTVPVNAPFTVQLVMEEDYNFRVVLRFADGREISKNTADLVGKLVE